MLVTQMALTVVKRVPVAVSMLAAAAARPQALIAPASRSGKSAPHHGEIAPSRRNAGSRGSGTGKRVVTA